MGVRLFKKFLLAPVDTAFKKPGPDHSGTIHFCPVDAQDSNGEKYTGDLKLQDAHGIGHGTQTKRFSWTQLAGIQNSLHPRQPSKTSSMRKFKKMAMKTLLEVQQREDIRRDLAERMKFVPPDLRTGERVFYWQEDPS